MTSRRHLGFVAAGATLLAATPLSGIFAQWTWLIYSAFAVAIVEAAATGVRAMRGRIAAQGFGMLAALILVLTLMFSNGHSLLGFIPTPDTVAYFGKLLGDAGAQIRDNGVPVPDLDGLLFLTTLGIGMVGILTDLFTVAMRRPALAGLPMLAIYAVPVAVYPDSVAVIPFVLGAAAFLWLLISDNVDRVRRFGRRFTGEGRDVDVWETSPLSSAGRRLAVVGVLVAIIVPLLIPQMSNSFFDQFGSAGGGSGTGGRHTGGPGSVNLFADLEGRLNQSSTQELVRVTTTDADPYYLRFAVADELTASGFRTRTPSGTSISNPLPDPNERSGPQVDRQRFTANVEIMKAFDMPMLPIYAEPVSIKKLGSEWSYDANMTVLFSLRSRSGGRNYDFDYVRSSPTPDQLNSAQELSVDNVIRRQFTFVPLNGAASEIVKELTKNATTPYQKVRAILAYFSSANGFRYDLSTQPGTSGQKIEDFLKNKVGFCEQYAAAMAWLVRTAGIPARVAFGFTRGQPVRVSNGQFTSSMTNRNLHAWTEVYFDGFGWIPFDATPSSSVLGSTSTAWAPDPNHVTQPSTGPSTGPGGVGGPTEDPGLQHGGAQGDGADLGADGLPLKKTSTWPWWALGGTFAVLLLLSIPTVRRQVLRRRRSREAADLDSADLATTAAGLAEPGVMVVIGEGDAQRARHLAHEAWDELMDTLIDFRVPADPAETPRSIARRLVLEQELAEDAAKGASRLGMAEERARYARTPLNPGPLSSSLRSVRSALAAGADRRTRIFAVIMPPSVIARWRLGLLDSTSRIVGRLGDLRIWLSRFSPRRLLSSSR
jgi:transglutaminase-like putative cysteine protease